MRDVLEDLIGWWQAGETVGMGTVVGDLALGAAAGRRVDAGRARRHRGRQRVRRLRRGRGLRGGQGRRRDRRARRSSATASATTTRSPSGLTCGGILDVFVESIVARVVPRAGRDRRVGRPARAGRRRHRACRAPTTGSAAGWCSGRTGRRARSGLQRLDDAVTADARGMLAAGRTGDAALRPRRRAPRRRPRACSSTRSRPPARMVVFGAIDFAAAVARIGAFLGYRVTVCDARPVFATPKRFPDAARGGRRVAAPLPAGRGRRRPDRRAHGALRAHPRPEVRRPAAGGRAAASRWPTSARWARGARTTSGRSGWREAGLTDEEIGAAVVADRARPRRPDAGGDRRLDRRRDHRRPVGRLRRAAGRDRGADPRDRRAGALRTAPVHSGEGIPFPVCRRRVGRCSRVCRTWREPACADRGAGAGPPGERAQPDRDRRPHGHLAVGRRPAGERGAGRPAVDAWSATRPRWAAPSNWQVRPSEESP